MKKHKFSAQENARYVSVAIHAICIYYLRMVYGFNLEPEDEASDDDIFWKRPKAGNQFGSVMPGPQNNPLTWWVDRYYPGMMGMLELVNHEILKNKVDFQNKMPTGLHFHFAAGMALISHISKGEFFARQLRNALEMLLQSTGQKPSPKLIQQYWDAVQRMSKVAEKSIPGLLLDKNYATRFQKNLEKMPDPGEHVQLNHPMPDPSDLLKPVETPPFFFSDFEPKQKVVYEAEKLGFHEMLVFNVLRMVTLLQYEDVLSRRQIDAWFPDFYDRLYGLRTAFLKSKFDLDNQQFVSMYAALDLLGILLAGPHAEKVNQLFDFTINIDNVPEDPEGDRKIQREFVASVQGFFQTAKPASEEAAFLEKFREQAAAFRKWTED